MPQALIVALVAVPSVAAQLLGVGQRHLLVGLLSGIAGLASRRFVSHRPNATILQR